MSNICIFRLTIVSLFGGTALLPPMPFFSVFLLARADTSLCGQLFASGFHRILTSIQMSPFQWYERRFLDASDVFAFGMILCELLVGSPPFWKGSRTGLDLRIAYRVSVEGERPEIPDSVLPMTRELITDCWAASPDDRPTFAAIVGRLVEMDFKITAKKMSTQQKSESL
jgi:serine/threonine protein kinase